MFMFSCKHNIEEAKIDMFVYVKNKKYSGILYYEPPKDAEYPCYSEFHISNGLIEFTEDFSLEKTKQYYEVVSQNDDFLIYCIKENLNGELQPHFFRLVSRMWINEKEADSIVIRSINFDKYLFKFSENDTIFVQHSIKAIIDEPEGARLYKYLVDRKTKRLLIQN